ncbi:MAG: fumarylacetoacetate hydrolase family protein [Chloroflexota bacterium]
MPVTQLCVFERDGRSRVGALREEGVYDLTTVLGWESLDDVLSLPVARIGAALRGVSWMEYTSFGLGGVTLKAPIGSQEVWAAGVTYLRSREARMGETHTPDIYDRVYEAERPELFLKATPSRTVGPGEPVGIRGDSSWDVAEPELVLVINSRMEVVGFAAGNDMSSRSIEGENPLYLPQAKIYDRCFALGPAITLVWELPDVHDLSIRMAIHRDGFPAYEGETSTRQLKRSFPELVRHVGRHNSFPRGVLLSTGTGIVPPDHFTLQAGDTVQIEIEQIGALVNPVVRLD